MAEPGQPPDHVDHLGIADVGHVRLEGEPEHQDRACAGAAALVDRVGDPLAHAVIGRPPGEDHARQIAEALRAVAEIIRIDADAVAADQARAEGEEIPLGPGGLEHVQGGDAELAENLGDLVHEGDVDVALGILDHLGRLGGLDRCAL